MTKRRIAIWVSTVLLLALGSFTMRWLKTDRSARAAATSEPEETSLIALIANPSAFAGKRVRVQGYVTLGFEKKAIYLTEEHYRRGLVFNSLRLDVVDEPGDFPSDGAYALIEATFDPDHRYFGNGLLTMVSRLDLYPKTTPPRPAK